MYAAAVGSIEATDVDACSTRARTKECKHCRCQQFSHDARGRAQNAPCGAELYAMNKGASEAMGIRSLAAGEQTQAASGLVNRHGVGKTRHMQEMWPQNALRNRELMSEENVADILTKNNMVDMVYIKATRRDVDDVSFGEARERGLISRCQMSSTLWRCHRLVTIANLLITNPESIFLNIIPHQLHHRICRF